MVSEKLTIEEVNKILSVDFLIIHEICSYQDINIDKKFLLCYSSQLQHAFIRIMEHKSYYNWAIEYLEYAINQYNSIKFIDNKIFIENRINYLE